MDKIKRDTHEAIQKDRMILSLIEAKVKTYNYYPSKYLVNKETLEVSIYPNERLESELSYLDKEIKERIKQIIKLFERSS